MRVRQLGATLKEEGLIIDGDLANLHGIRLGIDTVHWLRSLQSLKDPFAEALGGVPPGIYGFINNELDWFKRFNICPVFVFQGVAPGVRHCKFHARNELQMGKIWSHLARGNSQEASKLGSIASSRINSDFVYFVFHHLRHMGCEVVQAPCLVGAQLAHFHEQQVVDMVWGPPGFMMHNVQRVVLGMDLTASVFQYVDLPAVLYRWQLTHDQFVDACMAAGTEYCETYPFLNDPIVAPAHFNFKDALALIRSLPLIGWMQRFPTEEMRIKYTRDYSTCKVLVQSSPVFSVADNMVRPLCSCRTTSQVPIDFSILMGEKLPNSIYCLMLQGIMWHKLPTAISTGFWRDNWHPQVDTKEIRDLVGDLQEYRQLALGLLGGYLPANLTRKEIICKAYWQPSAEQSQGDDQVPSDCDKIIISQHMKKGLRWVIHIDELQREMMRQQTNKVDLKFCLQWHAHEFEADGTLYKDLLGSETTTVSKHKDCLAAAVHFMLLEHLEIIANDGMVTVLGSVLKDTPSHLQEPCLVALELMKFGVLNSEAFEVPPFGNPFPVEVNYPVAPVDAHTKSVLLLTRVFSLMPMKLRNARWNSDVIFDLTIFQSLVRVLKRSLRQLTEASLCSLLLDDMDRAKVLPPGFMCASPQQIDPLRPESIFPVFMLSGACMGIVCEYFLKYDGDPSYFHSEVTNRFPCCEHAISDLKDAMVFWEDIMRCVDEIAVQLQAQDLQREMKAASELLHLRQRQLQIYPDAANLRGDEPRQVVYAVLGKVEA